MKVWIQISYIVLVALALMGCGINQFSEDSCGFNTSSGSRVSWNSDLPIKIRIDTTALEFSEEIEEAIMSWNEAGEEEFGVKFFKLSPVPFKAADHLEKDGASVISIDDRWVSDSGLPQEDQATARIHSLANQIIEADIAINAESYDLLRSDGSVAELLASTYNPFHKYKNDKLVQSFHVPKAHVNNYSSSRFLAPTGELDNYLFRVDLVALLVHELGHVLGLTHDEGDGSVMNSRLHSGVQRSRRVVGDIDLGSLGCEYGHR